MRIHVCKWLAHSYLKDLLFAFFTFIHSQPHKNYFPASTSFLLFWTLSSSASPRWYGALYANLPYSGLRSHFSLKIFGYLVPEEAKYQWRTKTGEGEQHTYQCLFNQNYWNRTKVTQWWAWQSSATRVMVRKLGIFIIWKPTLPSLYLPSYYIKQLYKH